jgi:hypothetical protein
MIRTTRIFTNFTDNSVNLLPKFDDFSSASSNSGRFEKALDLGEGAGKVVARGLCFLKKLFKFRVVILKIRGVRIMRVNLMGS